MGLQTPLCISILTRAKTYRRQNDKYTQNVLCQHVSAVAQIFDATIHARNELSSRFNDVSGRNYFRERAARDPKF